MFFIINPIFLQATFQDVPPSHWAFRAVGELRKDGILVGYPSQEAKRPEDDPKLGKSDAEILKMGRDEWLAFSESKRSASTHSTSQALYVYSECRFVANKKMLQKLSKNKRDQIDRLGAHSQALAREIVTLGSYSTGGGTLWNIVTAATQALLADMQYALIIRKKTSAATPTAKQLEERLAKINNRLNENWRELQQLNPPHLTKKDIQESSTAAKKAIQAICKDLLKFDQVERKVVLRALDELIQFAE